jgi:hypothetical protein
VLVADLAGTAVFAVEGAIVAMRSQLCGSELAREGAMSANIFVE